MSRLVIYGTFKGVPRRHKRQLMRLLQDIGGLILDEDGECVVTTATDKARDDYPTVENPDGPPGWTQRDGEPVTDTEPNPWDLEHRASMDGPRTYAEMTPEEQRKVTLKQIGFREPIPTQVERVAKAWREGAENAAAQQVADHADGYSVKDNEAARAFWQGRLFGPVFCEHRGAWELSDNYEKCRILFYYPVRDKWTSMVPYADEGPDMSVEQAEETARIIWTG